MPTFSQIMKVLGWKVLEKGRFKFVLIKGVNKLMVNKSGKKWAIERFKGKKLVESNSGSLSDAKLELRGILCMDI